MAKFKIMETEETYTVTLRQNFNGTVTLKVEDYNILTITNNGEVRRIPDVPSCIGMSLDANGYVVILKDID